jgi:hypothetical protein
MTRIGLIGFTLSSPHRHRRRLSPLTSLSAAPSSGATSSDQLGISAANFELHTKGWSRLVGDTGRLLVARS